MDVVFVILVIVIWNLFVIFSRRLISLWLRCFRLRSLSFAE